MPTPHVHLNGASVLTVLAIMVVANVLINTTAGKRANKPAWQAAAFVI